MNNYRILSIMKDGSVGKLELSAPDDFTAVKAFDYVVQEHRLNVMFATLMRSNGDDWQSIMRTGK